MTGADKFVKVFWPIFASVAAGLFSLVSWYSTQAQQRYESLNKAIESATAPEGSTVRRIAGVWQMNQFWSEERFESTVAATLTGALVGVSNQDGLYRCAAAEVIGNAIMGTESYSTGEKSDRSKRIAHLLYGDRSGALGLVSELNRELAGTQPQRPPKTCERTTDVSALDATREAIRKNWEYLREINLNNTDLRGIPLYEADLDFSIIMGADLDGANLKCANLHGADLTGSSLDTANLQFANVSNLTPLSAQTLAIERGALAFPPQTWESWRLNGFRVDTHGNPVFNAARNKPDDSFPCVK